MHDVAMIRILPGYVWQDLTKPMEIVPLDQVFYNSCASSLPDETPLRSYLPFLEARYDFDL